MAGGSSEALSVCTKGWPCGRAAADAAAAEAEAAGASRRERSSSSGAKPIKSGLVEIRLRISLACQIMPLRCTNQQFYIHNNSVKELNLCTAADIMRQS